MGVCDAAGRSEAEKKREEGGLRALFNRILAVPSPVLRPHKESNTALSRARSEIKTFPLHTAA